MRKRDWGSFIEEAAQAFHLEMYHYLAKSHNRRQKWRPKPCFNVFRCCIKAFRLDGPAMLADGNMWTFTSKKSSSRNQSVQQQSTDLSRLLADFIFLGFGLKV